MWGDLNRNEEQMKKQKTKSLKKILKEKIVCGMLKH